MEALDRPLTAIYSLPFPESKPTATLQWLIKPAEL
jgi:hypothetical protein